MKRTFSAVLFLLLLPWTAATLWGQEAPRATFADTLSVDVVNVDLIVTDRKGALVRGLPAGSFQVFAGEKKVKATNFFEATTEELADVALIVYVDTLHLRAANRDRALDEIAGELRRLMERGVRVMVVEHDGALQLHQVLTDEPVAVTAAFAELTATSASSQSAEGLARALASDVDDTLQLLGRGAREQRLATSSLDGLASQLQGYAQSVGEDVRRSVESLSSLVSALGGVPGRKALVYVSDGLAMRPLDQLMQTLQSRIAGARRGGGGDLMTSTGSGFGEGPSTGQLRDETDINQNLLSSSTPDMTLVRLQQVVDQVHLQADFERLAALANTSRVSFFPVMAPAGDASAAERRTVGSEEAAKLSNVRESLEYLAASTAGVAQTSGTGVEGFLAEVGGVLGDYYSLGLPAKLFSHAEPTPIRVKVKKGGRLSYRQLLYASSFESRFGDRTIGALMLGLTQNPHRLEAEVESSEAQADGSYEVSLIVTVPIGELTLVEEGGLHRANARVAVAVLNPSGGLAPVSHLQVPLQIPQADLASAITQHFGARVNLRLASGRQLLALGLWDLAADRGSFVRQELHVGAD